MKWIFITMVLVNITVYVMFFGVKEVLQPPVDEGLTDSVVLLKDGVKRLRLVGERAEYENIWPELAKEEGENKIAEESSAEEGLIDDVVVVEGGVVSPTTICEIYGPFNKSVKAGALQARITAMGFKSFVQEKKVPTGVKYQVLLPKEKTRKLALQKLKQLQAKKIDSYLILKGEHENSVSLGLFRKEEFAERHLDRLKKKGLAPFFVKIEDLVVEYWVVMKQAEVQKINKKMWKNLLTEINFKENREIFCLDVASSENFL